MWTSNILVINVLLRLRTKTLCHCLQVFGPVAKLSQPEKRVRATAEAFENEGSSAWGLARLLSALVQLAKEMQGTTGRRSTYRFNKCAASTDVSD